MHIPPSPGEFIREICLEPLGLTVTQAAKDLGVSRKALSELLNAKQALVQKWHYAWQKLLILHQKVGLPSKCIMIYGKLKRKRNTCMLKSYGQNQPRDAA